MPTQARAVMQQGKGGPSFPHPPFWGHISTSAPDAGPWDQGMVANRLRASTQLGGMGSMGSTWARGRPWERGLPPQWEIQPHWGKPARFSAGGSSTEGTEMPVPCGAGLSGHEWQHIPVRDSGCSPQPGGTPTCTGGRKEGSGHPHHPGCQGAAMAMGDPTCSQGGGLAPTQMPPALVATGQGIPAQHTCPPV